MAAGTRGADRLRCAHGPDRQRRLQFAVADPRADKRGVDEGERSTGTTARRRPGPRHPGIQPYRRRPAHPRRPRRDQTTTRRGRRRRQGGGRHRAVGCRTVRVRTQRCGEGSTRFGERRPARRYEGRGHRRARIRRRYRELVLRGQHHPACGDRTRGGTAADRHLPLTGAVAGSARGDRVRRSRRGRRRHRGRAGVRVVP